MILKDRLGLFALALVAVGIAFFLVPGGHLQGVGGIVFGTGLTVFLGRLTNRQQLAKEANLRRKTEVYEPLYIELLTLGERLEKAREGIKPYLQQIDVPGQASLPQLEEEPPRLQRWSEFKADSRYLEFSDASRHMLDQTLKLAVEYNASVEAALEAFEATLAKYIQIAVSDGIHNPDFQQWLQSPPDVRFSSPDNDWFAEIRNAQESERSRSPYRVHMPEWLPPKEDKYIPPEVGVEWATAWLRGWGAVKRKPRAPYDMTVPLPRRATPRPATLGWLLAGNREGREKALEVICTTFHSRLSLPPALIEHFRGIMDEAWPELESLQTYREVRSLHEKLLNQVSRAERKFKGKLKHIQNTYEGGPPLL